jgi:hypothetical protein
VCRHELLAGLPAADPRRAPSPHSARLRLTIQDKNKYNTPKYRLVVRFVRAQSRGVAAGGWAAQRRRCARFLRPVECGAPLRVACPRVCTRMPGPARRYRDALPRAAGARCPGRTLMLASRPPRRARRATSA